VTIDKQNGGINGKPSKPGTYTFTITFKNEDGVTITKEVTLVVKSKAEAAEEAVSKKLVKTGDKKDPNGSSFSRLRLTNGKVKSSIALKWNKVRAREKVRSLRKSVRDEEPVQSARKTDNDETDGEDSGGRSGSEQGQIPQVLRRGVRQERKTPRGIEEPARYDDWREVHELQIGQVQKRETRQEDAEEGQEVQAQNEIRQSVEEGQGTGTSQGSLRIFEQEGRCGIKERCCKG
jgi:hypothetical protein